MNAPRIIGIVIIVLGAIGLARTTLTYTTERHQADLGPIKVSVDERKTVEVPIWAGVALIAVGAGLVALPARKRAM